MGPTYWWKAQQARLVMHDWVFVHVCDEYTSINQFFYHKIYFIGVGINIYVYYLYMHVCFQN
jgi:hypothetical protein